MPSDTRGIEDFANAGTSIRGVDVFGIRDVGSAAWRLGCGALGRAARCGIFSGFSRGFGMKKDLRGSTSGKRLATSSLLASWARCICAVVAWISMPLGPMINTGAVGRGLTLRVILATSTGVGGTSAVGAFTNLRVVTIGSGADLFAIASAAAASRLAALIN